MLEDSDALYVLPLIQKLSEEDKTFFIEYLDTLLECQNASRPLPDAKTFYEKCKNSKGEKSFAENT